jgi:hypothetical protein
VYIQVRTLDAVTVARTWHTLADFTDLVQTLARACGQAWVALHQPAAMLPVADSGEGYSHMQPIESKLR